MATTRDVRVPALYEVNFHFCNLSISPTICRFCCFVLPLRSLQTTTLVNDCKMWSKFFFLLAFVPVFVQSLAATDEIQDADAAQSGYMDNHNMHPSTVGSPAFGILWKNQYGNKERWYAKPLVYTPPGSSQIVFLASAMNVLRVVDAVNGTLLNSRTVQPPFLQSDIGCTDIPDFIGIIVSRCHASHKIWCKGADMHKGTPIIDPSTNTAYFFSKGYKNGASNGGVANGRYHY